MGGIPAVLLPNMTVRIRQRPLFPGGEGVPGYGGGQDHSGAEGAKNTRPGPGRYLLMNLCTYNVRTLRTEADLLGLLNELSLIKWDVVGLCEVRRLGEEQKILNNGHVLYWRGKPQDSKQESGVGFLVHKRLEKNIVEFYSVSERVASVTLKLNDRYNLKIVQVYAPTCSHPDEEVESFYEDVQVATDRAKAHFTVIMGDFNAKVGKKVERETAIGNHGIGTRNERGQMLVEFAEARSLHIMNTFYKKRTNRKWTWKSPSGIVNEIDFILTDRRDIVKNVGVINKVNVGSDHRMVRSEIKLSLRMERKKLIQKPPPNLANLVNRTTEFSLNIQNRYSILDEENHDIDQINEQFTNIMKEAALEVGGRLEKQNSNKLSIETRQLMQKRRNMKVTTARDNIELAELTKTINKKKKEDVRKFNMQKVNEALISGTSVKTTKRKLGIGKSQMYAIKKHNGEVTYNRNEILKVVEDFYTDLYNSNDITQTEMNIAIEDVPDITVDEIKMAIKSTKRGKTAGEDGISIDLIKDAGEIASVKLANLFTKCVREGKIPKAWKNAIIILIHKKGDTKDLKNYRPISLLSVIYKLFTKVITNRITETLDSNQPREQAGFRSGFSTTDHIHAVNQIIEKTNEYTKPLAIAFIDYEKAFDSVLTSAVLETIRKQGVEEAYCRVLEDIYKDGTATIKLHEETNKIPIKKGVRQGDTISPKLFTACLEEIFRKLNWRDRGIKIGDEYLSNLRFADDIVLFSESANGLQQMLEELNRESLKVGLKMNKKKTKIMFNRHIQAEQIQIQNEALEVVDEYVYLGQLVQTNTSFETEIKRRIKLGWSAFGRHSNILRGSLPLCLKRKVFNQCVLSVMTYGSETWTTILGTERKLTSTQRAMERLMLGVRLRDKKKASEIREQTKVEDIIKSIKKKKWQWVGHVCRRQDNRWTKKVTDWDINDKRPKGRPPTRWRDEIDKFEKSGVRNWKQTWKQKTQDRKDWKKLGEAYVLQWTDTG